MIEFTFWVQRIEEAGDPSAPHTVMWGLDLICDCDLLGEHFTAAEEMHVLDGDETSSISVHIYDTHFHDRMFDDGFPVGFKTESELHSGVLISNRAGYREIYDGSIEFDCDLEPHMLPTFLRNWPGFKRGEGAMSFIPESENWVGVLWCQSSGIFRPSYSWRLHAFSRLSDACVQAGDSSACGTILSTNWGRS